MPAVLQSDCLGAIAQFRRESVRGGRVVAVRSHFPRSSGVE
jgi:hypothetical protein